MENLIPVLVIGGIVGFLLWKNKDKIVQRIESFRNRGQASPVDDSPIDVVNEVKPSVVESPRSESPVVDPQAPAQTPEVSITERLFGISPEVAAYRDGLVEASRGKVDDLEKLPKLMPGTLLLGRSDARAPPPSVPARSSCGT